MKLEIKQVDGSGYYPQAYDSGMNRMVSESARHFIDGFFHIHALQREKKRKKIQQYK